MPTILVIAHVGETLGHVARAASVIRELQSRNNTVHIAASPEAFGIIADLVPDARRHALFWQWSHNDHVPEELKVDLARQVGHSYQAILSVIRSVQPDLIVGFPGLLSTFAARSLGVPHVSVLHGVYLAPLIELPRHASPPATVILSMARQMCALADKMARWLASSYSAPLLSYDEYLRTEPIFVPQPGLSCKSGENVTACSFISASIGDDGDSDNAPDLSQACHVTFGSGNPCDISMLVKAASDVFERVVVATGKQPAVDLPNVFSRPLIPSRALAGRVPYVVSHGGLGTLGTFAAHGARQLIVPTELDQAMTAIYAEDTGLALTEGVSAWTARPATGRRFPPLSERQCRDALERLKALPPQDPAIAAGASEIASGVERLLA